MAEPYPIVDVTAWLVASDEVLGSKPKVWLEADGGVRWLYKERHRNHTGDDWAEKIASEVAARLGIPHATVELARRNGSRGIITRDLVQELGGQELVLGNSLLVEADPGYPTGNRFHVAEHTIDRVFAALAQPFIRLPPGTPEVQEIKTPPDLFAGFLMLDALIANTDRHHENWAIIQMNPKDSERVAVLCPSFDHAACLGHNLDDGERSERLSTRDVNRTVAAFVRSAKVRCALYRSSTDRKSLSPIGAWSAAAERVPDAARYWAGRLADLPAEMLTDIVFRVPNAIMSSTCRTFVCGMVAEIHKLLLSGAP